MFDAVDGCAFRFIYRLPRISVVLNRALVTLSQQYLLTFRRISPLNQVGSHVVVTFLQGSCHLCVDVKQRSKIFFRTANKKFFRSLKLPPISFLTN
jgi:hypothetical protein